MRSRLFYSSNDLNIMYKCFRPGKCQISETSRIHFENAVYLLGVDKQILEAALLSRSLNVKDS